MDRPAHEMSRPGRFDGIAGTLLLGAGACSGYDGQSALDPAGPQAAAVQGLWSLQLAIAVAVYVIVIVALGIVIWRRRTVPVDAAASRSYDRESRARRTVIIAVGATAGVLFIVLFFDLAVARSLTRLSASPALSIHVIGHQWWWEVEYEDSVPQQRVRLANEIHIPVGQSVLVKLDSRDVIHSFWVPNLAGKRDLIPGHHTETWLRADRAGVYRSQCAEFCGLQHAKMALLVVAEPREQFDAWLAAQRVPAPPPTDMLAARGRTVLEAGPCALCHTVASTLARGRVGPDLSHVASRRTIAAGTLPNAPGYLAGWITDPQTIKPGVLMPVSSLAPEDLRALLAYLATLR